MLRRALSLCVVLGLASSAYAGAAISLVASDPAAGVGQPYAPGEVVNVGVFAQLTAGTPSVPGPAGTTTSIRVRSMQFNLGASDPALVFAPVFHHPGADIGPIPFWDLSGSSSCAGDEAGCGLNYFIVGSIAATDTPSITYAGLTSSGSLMVVLNQAEARRVGELQVTMPDTGGNYILDVLNANETDPNFVSLISWGFGGTSADVTDPSSPLTAGNTAGSGGLFMIAGQESGFSFAVVPEPATLVLLGMGGLAAAFRRRRSA
jgi:hypothetical protein